jgi:hypothetical protein
MNKKAIHEAGHAVMAWRLLDRPFRFVALDPAGCRYAARAEDWRDETRVVLVSAAGRLATEIAFGPSPDDETSAIGDLELARRFTGLPKLTFGAVAAVTAGLLAREWPVVLRVAQALEARGRLDATDMAALCGRRGEA